MKKLKKPYLCRLKLRLPKHADSVQIRKWPHGGGTVRNPSPPGSGAEKRSNHENRRRQRHSLSAGRTRALRRGRLPARQPHRARRRARRRRARRPHPHPVRRRPARRLVRTDDRHGHHRLRPHRPRLLPFARHPRVDGRRMQRPRRAAMGRRGAGPPGPHAGLDPAAAHAGRRRSGPRRLARAALRRGMGTPRAKAASTAASCRSARWRTRPTS